jgi:hypothetical protein
MTWRPAPLVAVGSLVLGACVGASSGQPSTVSPTATAIETAPPVNGSPTLSASITPTPKPAVQTPTARPRTTGPCPPTPADLPLPFIENPLDFGDGLLQYLDAGGSIEALVEQADLINVITMPTPQGAFARPDLDGDGVPEIALALADWSSGPAKGRFYLAMCEAGRYRLLSAPLRAESPVVRIHAAIDITGDDNDDLLIGTQSCGASTCFQDFDLLSWSEAGVRDLLVDYGSEYAPELPSPGVQVFGRIMDGSRMFVITFGAFSSAGAGPPREQSLTYWRDPESGLFMPISVRLLPSTFRIHVVHDADRSFALGNYQAALEAYNRAVLDDSLDDWPSGEFEPPPAGSRRLALAAYARFRRVLARLMMDDPASAEVHYRDLLEQHPAGTPGAGFARMGEIFWQEFKDTGDLNAACAAARRFAEDNPSEVLDPLDYGYGNPQYTPSGLCPAVP